MFCHICVVSQDRLSEMPLKFEHRSGTRAVRKRTQSKHGMSGALSEADLSKISDSLWGDSDRDVKFVKKKLMASVRLLMSQVKSLESQTKRNPIQLILKSIEPQTNWQPNDLNLRTFESQSS